MIPAIAILRAGTDGALAGVINMVFHEGQPVNAMFFWLTGSSPRSSTTPRPIWCSSTPPAATPRI